MPLISHNGQNHRLSTHHSISFQLLKCPNSTKRINKEDKISLIFNKVNNCLKQSQKDIFNGHIYCLSKILSDVTAIKSQTIRRFFFRHDVYKIQ